VPLLSVVTLRLALSCLAVGFSLGALLLAAPALALPPDIVRFRPLHVELLLIGWMVQLALGVAYWILPRRQGGSRGNESLAWTALALLNLGVLSVGLGALVGAPRGVLLAGRSSELLAALLFAAHAWVRIRPYSPRSIGS